MIKPTRIICHGSASLFGDATTIDGWHRQRGFDGIGYHGVILNGHRTARSGYNDKLDGKIEPGRPESRQGAHCAAGGMNRVALGVCLIGDSTKRAYTDRQIAALVHWLATMCQRYGIPPSRITQHSDHDRGKPHCAGLDMPDIRRRVAARLAGTE